MNHNLPDKISELEAKLNRLQAPVESVDSVLIEIDASGQVLMLVRMWKNTRVISPKRNPAISFLILS